MSEQTAQLLNACDTLPSEDKRTFVVEIIADEEIGEAGKAVFALLDREENAAAATTQSPFRAMRGEFEVPEDWD
jgi:hypothetical protein